MMGILASEIAKFIGCQLFGGDICIDGYASLSDNVQDKLLFAKKYSSKYTEILNKKSNVLAIVGFEYKDKLNCSYICSNNPRLDYIRCISHFFTKIEMPNGIHPSAVVEDGAFIGKNVRIGANCFISRYVTIGDNTIIMPNVVLDNIVRIGSDCIVKSGTVIGQSGFGYEYDENNEPIQFPHSGSVVIGNNVHIGANVTIDRATLSQTIIDDNVKIDNHVHVAHNCIIHKNSLIIAGAILCGGVEIGENCWISPNASIMQKTKVGSFSTVGMGSVVIRRVNERDAVFGNPADSIV